MTFSFPNIFRRPIQIRRHGYRHIPRTGSLQDPHGRSPVEFGVDFCKRRCQLMQHPINPLLILSKNNLQSHFDSFHPRRYA